MTAKTTVHTHPRPGVYKVQQYGALALLVVMLLAVPFQLFLAVALQSLLFGLTVVALLLLTLPVIMLLTVSPPVSVDDDGLHLQPLVGRAQTIAWVDVLDMKNYTLLPSAEQETERRLIQGRKKYRPVEGKMLIVRGLPAQYRVAGFFAGESRQPIVALTSRTHTDYDRLIQRVTGYLAQHHPAGAAAGR